jgi:hypothetical protein
MRLKRGAHGFMGRPRRCARRRGLWRRPAAAPRS